MQNIILYMCQLALQMDVFEDEIELRLFFSKK